MDWDWWLGHIKVKGRPLKLYRLNWWFVIGLSKVFGRKVRLENTDGQTIRLLPVVWNGKIHLLGAQDEVIQADFTSKYSLRLRRAPDITLSDGQPVPIAGPEIRPAAIHVVVCHLPPPRTEFLLHYLQTKNPHTIVLAYGGEVVNFDSIRWKHKFFFDDPLMRGMGHRYSYFRVLRKLRDYLAGESLDATWFFVTDYDTVPTHDHYLDELVAIMTAQQAGFAGQLVREVSLSNSFFVIDSEEQNLLDDSLNGPGKTALYHCIGAVLFFHRDCLQRIFQEDRPFYSAFLELTIPTDAHRLGFRLLSFDKFTDAFRHVRYRPVYSAEEAVEATAQGARFLHPLKNLEDFLRQLPARPDAKKISRN